MSEIIEYRGHKINIYRDDMPMNPAEEWDVIPPMVVAYLDRGSYHKIEYGHGIELPELSWEDIEGDTILSMFASESFEELVYDYGNGVEMDGSDGDIELINEAMDNYLQGYNLNAQLELIEDVYRHIGVTATIVSSTGYSQGDYARLLLVATPEWLKRMGLEKIDKKALAHYSNEYCAYMWGDVYYYNVDGPLSNDCCSGFYGYDHEKSGLLQSAKEHIDWSIEEYKVNTVAHVKDRRQFEDVNNPFGIDIRTFKKEIEKIT